MRVCRGFGEVILGGALDLQVVGSHSLVDEPVENVQIVVAGGVVGVGLDDVGLLEDFRESLDALLDPVGLSVVEHVVEESLDDVVVDRHEGFGREAEVVHDEAGELADLSEQVGLVGLDFRQFVGDVDSV